MVLYTCQRCGRKFDQKCKYDRHINRKFKCCINNLSSDDENDDAVR